MTICPSSAAVPDRCSMYDLTARLRSYALGSPRFGPPSSRGTQASGPEGAVSVGEVGPTPSRTRPRKSPGTSRVAWSAAGRSGSARPCSAPAGSCSSSAPCWSASRSSRPGWPGTPAAPARGRRATVAAAPDHAAVLRRLAAEWSLTEPQGRRRLRVGHRGQRRVGDGRVHPRHRRPRRPAGRLGARVERLGRAGREPSRGGRRAAEDRPVAGHHAGRHRRARGSGPPRWAGRGSGCPGGPCSAR